MREIKFRAWDKEQKRLVYDFETTPYFNSRVIAKYSVKYCMQYTGLKDNNGVEIYEGDVIRAKHDDGRYDIGNIVYGSKGAFCLHLPNVGTGIKTPLLNYIHGIMFAESDFEVIGNIYEQPELLEATQ